MNITLKSEELNQLKDVPAVDIFLRYNSWNQKKSMKVDVASLSEKQLEQVVKVLLKNEAANATPLLIIKHYKKARENPKDAKAWRLEHFASLLKEYVATAEKYYLFTQTDDGDWLPYLVTDIEFHARRKRSPAYVSMSMKYYAHGKVKDESEYFYAEDIAKKTCSQILDSKGYTLGTKEVIENHSVEVEKFKRYRAAVGMQVLGSGEAEVIGAVKSWWGGKSLKSVELAPDGKRSHLVVDDQEEEEEDRRDRGEKAESPLIDDDFWSIEKGKVRDDDDEDDAEGTHLEVPLHPVVICFHLEKHAQCWVHVNHLQDYSYDKTMGEKLVLPEFQRNLIDVLVQKDRAEFQDIVKGKAGGSIVLCSGVPGTGKTLTAEVFAEVIERPLYCVQSSQLGVTAEELEGELIKVLSRAIRWGAILLIDEADVFIRTRGEDINQNAIVGAFLRVLEYYSGVLFMTTNRETSVDDAIISRCTAQVKYSIPTPEGQAKIWRILADVSGIKLPDSEVKKFVKRHPAISGRDVKGLLKLANMISVREKKPITCESIQNVMRFKPTYETTEEFKKNK